jgi:hypothetical protein
MYVCMHVCMYVCMHACMYVCMCDVCMYVQMCAHRSQMHASPVFQDDLCVNGCVNVYIWIFMHV